MYKSSCKKQVKNINTLIIGNHVTKCTNIVLILSSYIKLIQGITIFSCFVGTIAFEHGFKIMFPLMLFANLQFSMETPAKSSKMFSSPICASVICDVSTSLRIAYSLQFVKEQFSAIILDLSFN